MVYDQFLIMFYMVISGLYFGAAFDTHQRIARLWRHRTFFVYIFEVSFWMLQAAIFFSLLFFMNDGELRLYFFLSCLLGYAIYQVFFASTFQKVLELLIRGIKKGWFLCKRVLYVCLFVPIRWLLQVLLTIIIFIGSVIWQVFMFLLRPFFWLFRLLFGLLPEKIQKKLHKFPQFYSIIGHTVKKILRRFKR